MIFKGIGPKTALRFWRSRALWRATLTATFRPEQPVTRAEFATLIIKAFSRSPSRPAITFTDVLATYWAASSIQKAYVTGWLAGYPGNRFQPNLPIPRVQAVVALVAGFGYLAERSTQATLNQLFSDSDAIPAYAKDRIAAAAEQRLVVNYPDIKQFRPNKPATRERWRRFSVRRWRVRPISPARLHWNTLRRCPNPKFAAYG